MIILASASQRRIDLLKDAGIEFEVIPSQVEEKINDNLSPEENAISLATAKARDVYARRNESLVLAADTVVVYKNQIFGKPKDKEDAFNMLKTLSNNTHEVITGVAIIKDGKEEVFFSKAKVKFKDLTDEVINEYIETNEPFGKAGAYAIQGLGKKLVDTFTGDFFTIVGLPLKEVLERLKKYSE